MISFSFEGWDKPNSSLSTRNLNEDDILNDPKHPMNNPKLITEVHFVGRMATDSSIIELSTLLMNHDTYGSIKELWLNKNLISDDGASAIASFLQLPTCALVELWLGDNQIGPVGTALISVALSNNSKTKLTTIGLYNNPIGIGAMTIAQMLRKNHCLTTVDVHGCGRGRGSSMGCDVMEEYGCKVMKVVAPLTEEDEELVTDQRLLDAIQTYVAFNRINPTREQVIKGIMDSKKPSQDDDPTKADSNADNSQSQAITSKLLSGLRSNSANERLTDEEKQAWKDYEWDRLHAEIDRARSAKSDLANLLETKDDILNEVKDLLENDGTGGMQAITVRFTTLLTLSAPLNLFLSFRAQNSAHAQIFSIHAIELRLAEILMMKLHKSYFLCRRKGGPGVDSIHWLLSLV